MFPLKTLIVATSAALAFTTSAQADVSPVRVRVEQVSKSDSDSKKHSKTVKRSLKIHISNSSAEPVEVTVKYVIFGREMDGRDIVSVDEGGNSASLKPRATEIVETKTTSATYVDAHRDKDKKIEGSGTKLLGYGVQVFQGDKMVAEAYDPLSMKESWTKLAPATKAK